MEQIPLSHEASAGDTHKQVTDTLPPEVVQCLENARFLHLATCTDNVPHVSLMNYTYLPCSPYSTSPVIVMTTNPSSKKMTNLVANPSVSLLVHDWVSHRPPTSYHRRLSSGSASPERSNAAATNAAAAAGPPSSLASLLLNLNTSAVSSISATINGAARLSPPGSAEEAFYRARHLENNTFGPEAAAPGASIFGAAASLRRESVVAAPPGGDADGQGAAVGRGRFGAAEQDVRVIVVGIRDVRISDWKGAVRDWVLVPPVGEGEGGGGHLVNGVR